MWLGVYFDVQEQYDAKAITPKRHDSALMYNWRSPKRYLKVFPQPKEHNKKLVVYLYWIDEDGYENFNRVIWSTDDCGVPDFKIFIASEYIIGSNDKDSMLSVGDFFETKDDLLKNRLSELNCRYEIKYSGLKGHSRQDYVCPKTNVFGLKLFGEEGCSYCRYCAAIKDLPKGFESYCCYPNQVNEVLEENEGYECLDVPRF